jgi:tetratricopeptide (TPR) repeat protein
VLHNANTPYAFGLESYGSAAWHDVGQLPLPSDGPGALARALAALEGQDSVVPHVRLGDLLFRNADLMLDAMREYEAALAIAPEDPLPLERLARIALYHGFAEAAVGPLLRLGPGFEVELADAYSRIEDLAGAERWSRRAVERDGYDAAGDPRAEVRGAGAGRGARGAIARPAAAGAGG